jgi:hypothetical protein
MNSPGKASHAREDVLGAAAIKGPGGVRGAGAKIVGLPGDHQRRSRIQDHDVAKGRARSIKQIANGACVLSRIAAAHR